MGSSEVPAEDKAAGEEALEEPAPAAGAAQAPEGVHGDEVQRLTRQVEDYLNKLLYLQADFENYRKRAEREKEEFRKYANELLVLELLEPYENLERALAVARQKDEQIAKGLEMVYGQMTNLLRRYGLKPIEAVGHRFDPRQHEAMMQEVSADVEEDTVLEEFQRGYTLNSKVIRCAKVKVSKR